MTSLSPGMGHWLAVAAGGALGATLRFWVASRVLVVPAMPAWPWATFSVNLVGSLLFGLLAVALAGSATLNEQWRFFLMTGLLGAFTTWSTFSFEVVTLIENRAWGLAGGYGLATFVGCVAAAGIGLMLGRLLFE